MRRSLGILAGVIVAAALLAPAAQAQFSKTLDRRYPQFTYCPLDNDDYDLTFTATSDRAKITLSVNNLKASDQTWLAHRFDNIAVLPKTLFDANRHVTGNFEFCFVNPPGPANYPGYNFSAANTPETFIDLFDTNAALWDLTNYGFFDTTTPQSSAPRDSVSGNDRSGGSLSLGLESDGDVTVKTDFTVTGLTPGTLYILTGWWYTADLNTLTVTFDTNPCKDNDGDGVTDCAGDCNDGDPKIKPGALEACDGRDNDCNGTIDDPAACAKTCTTTTKIGSDLRVTNAQFTSTHPSIAWNGIDYGMVWKDSRNGDQEIFFTRLTAAGAKVGGDVPITGSCFDCDSPRIVWAGGEYGAVWRQNDAIMFRRISRTGTPLGAAGTPLIDPAGSSADEPDIVWTGTEYGVVWDQFVGPQQIRFARVDRLGNLASGYLKVTNDTSFNGNSRPRIAFGAGRYGIAWEGNNFGPHEIFFRRVDQRQGLLPALQITNHGQTALAPSIVWNGTEWGIAWQDHRSFTEVYFQRVTAAGAKNGTELRVTNNGGVSNEPSLAWTGTEYGVAWQDDRAASNNEIWFARISSAAVKQGSDLQITTDTAGSSDQPTLAWGGGKFAVGFRDDRFAGDQEILFLRLGCNCVDSDSDGATSCVDCDDTHASVVAGGAQVCDGLNNDCNDVNWPLLTGTNEVDADADTFTVCAGDCNDANGTIWATPGEVRSLVMSHNKSNGISTLSWTAPLLPGGSAIVYDTLRSGSPSNFTASTTCVETNDGANTAATDSTTPAAGSVFYYLTRAEDACPSGIGILHRNSAGATVTGRTCP
jgi:hypothetical protein